MYIETKDLKSLMFERKEILLQLHSLEIWMTHLKGSYQILSWDDLPI